jgi:hypothetical protein
MNQAWQVMKNYILLSCLAMTGCWYTSSLSPSTPSSISTESFTGSFARRQFTSESEVNAFNSEISKWFSKQGFVPDESTTFHTLSKSDEWKKPGLLLCQRHDPASRIYVFIPECYHPETHVQIIGYHVELRGSVEEVKQLRRDFECLEEEYRKQFCDKESGKRD